MNIKHTNQYTIIGLIVLNLGMIAILASPVIVVASDSEIKVYLENQPMTFDVPPQTISGRVMVPMRAIFETMGATLDWDSDSQTATAVKGATTVIAQIGNSNASINGETKRLDVPPTAMDSRTLAPLRFVAEAFGYYVKWDAVAQTAYISVTPFSEPVVVGDVNVGGTVYFGTYEQDNETSNGPEPIAWKVLAVENSKALLLSEKGLDCKSYNETRTDVTWETCSLRSWLNNDFYRTAFSSTEQSKIILSNLSNPDNSKAGTKGGDDTRDKIFCLSIDEARCYFSPDEERYNGPEYYIVNLARCIQPTSYAIANGAWVYNLTEESEYSGKGVWWLRSSGGNQNRASIIDYGGAISSGGYYIDDCPMDDGCVDNYRCVRPALWINL